MTLTFDACDHSGSISRNGDIVLQIFEEYSQRRLNGENPTIQEYQDAYPELADRIGEVLQAMDAMTATLNLSQAAPETIAGCRILREVGTGAAGTVYEAVHPKVSRRLAIKVLKIGESGERFLREAELLSRLTHPNIVPFLDCGQDGDLTYLSMHYIDGVSLDILLKNHRQQKADTSSTLSFDKDDPLHKIASTIVADDYQRIATLGADIASALQYAHSNRVIHRDIKPGNLLLDRNGKVWVSDFGLAKAFLEGQDGNLTRDMVGTPRYMAPEQIRGICSFQSDIYSLGVSLYELASGTVAWETISQRKLVMERQGLDLPSLAEIAPEVPTGLARIIMKACALKPEDRYETAAELENVLRRFAETGKQGDRRHRERYEGQKYIRRRPVGAIAAVVALALGTVMLWPSTDDEEPRDAVSLLQAAQDPDFQQLLVDSLPDNPEDDTPEAKQFRTKVATEAHRTFGMLWEKAGVSERDRQVWDHTVAKYSKAFMDGDFRKKTKSDKPIIEVGEVWPDARPAPNDLTDGMPVDEKKQAIDEISRELKELLPALEAESESERKRALRESLDKLKRRIKRSD